jgi:hypothetical protein
MAKKALLEMELEALLQNVRLEQAITNEIFLGDIEEQEREAIDSNISLTDRLYYMWYHSL